MSFDRIQCQEKPLADLLIRESPGDQSQDFQFTLAQWLDQGLGRRRTRFIFSRLRLNFKCCQQPSNIVRHHSTCRGFGQELRHWGTFVEKDTNEAARLRQCQRIGDLFTAPWSLLVHGPRGMDMRPAASELRSLLRINQRPAPLRRPALHLADLVRRVVARIDRGLW